MAIIASDQRLESVEYIIASGVGVLDFAIEGETGTLTWRGREDADWTVEDVSHVENSTEDRVNIYPEGDYFTCEISADGEEHNEGPVRCWCE